MEHSTSDPLARIVPIVRGLLASTTGDADIPYSPVIISCSDEPDKAADENPLCIDSVQPDQESEKIRELLKTAIDAYVNQYGSKPKVISLDDLGVIHLVEEAGDNSQNPLHNKVALVTGAAGAIGYGICRALLEKGCYLAASDLAGEKLDNFTDDLKLNVGKNVMGVPLDVTQEPSVAAAFQRVNKTWGGVDIVVINAGIGLVSTIQEMSLEAFRQLEKVNLEGTLLTLAQASRQLILQNTGGDIIIVSTKNVPSPSASFGAYSATKAASHQLGRIASLELAPYGIRVNMVAPDGVFSEGKYKSGFWVEVGTDRMKARGLDEKGLQEYYRNRNLLKARVTGRHVGNAVLFFATRQTPTTGATLPVDGGLPDATPR
jgi:NAD(P)-dependent dehydrogenase (short-subunit alcohol dehydrogenase family)